jgi:hypothetical protein
LLIGSSLALAAAGFVNAFGEPAHAELPTIAPINVAPGLDIYPRESWGADLPPTRPITTGEDVRFLLVHHTAGTNKVANGGTVTRLRKTYAYQTGSGKGWPDVCYQFFVDRDGLVWEGRTGSLAGPVVADATGGSQGFAQLVCLIGNFTNILPTVPQQASLIRTLAWLADRYQIDTAPGATTSFASRGSNRFKRGVIVTAKTISGHRDMSKTACPGNKFYPVVRDNNMQALVTDERARMALARNGGFPFSPSEHTTESDSTP